jgi:excisionase family DNA binding protein
MMSHSDSWKDRNYMKVGEITKMLNVSRQTIYVWVEEKNFPKPFVFGDAKKNTTVRWLEAEVKEWLDNLPRGKND